VTLRIAACAFWGSAERHQHTNTPSCLQHRAAVPTCRAHCANEPLDTSSLIRYVHSNHPHAHLMAHELLCLHSCQVAHAYTLTRCMNVLPCSQRRRCVGRARGCSDQPHRAHSVCKRTLNASHPVSEQDVSLPSHTLHAPSSHHMHHLVILRHVKVSCPISSLHARHRTPCAFSGTHSTAMFLYKQCSFCFGSVGVHGDDEFIRTLCVLPRATFADVCTTTRFCPQAHVRRAASLLVAVCSSA
jgi:hypothetical protein